MKKAVAALLSVLCFPAVVQAEDAADSWENEAREARGGTQVAQATATPHVTGSATAPAAPAPAAPVGAPAAPAATLTATSEEDLKAQKPWSFSVDLDESIGHGTFVRIGDLGSIETNLGFGANYKFKVKDINLSASGGLGFSYELTRPDNVNARRWNYSDPRLGLSAPKIFTEKVTGIDLTPSMGLTIPLSYGSRTAGTITSLSLSARLGRAFGKQFSAGWTIRGGRNFHTNPAIVFGPDSDLNEDGFARTLCRTGEEVCDTGGVNTVYSFGNTLNVSYKPIEKLSLGVSYGLSHSWKYVVADELDAESSKVLDTEGNRVVKAGMTRAADSVSGTISVGYSITDRYSASFAMGSRSRAKQSDNTGFRFPWFDFSGAAGGSVSYSLGLSASF